MFSRRTDESDRSDNDEDGAAMMVSNYYVIKFDEEIGKGSTGNVYKGLRKADSSEVAIKIVFRRKLDQRRVECIRNEVYALQRLDHPNIVKFHNIFEDPHSFYLCLELVRGGELFTRLSKRHVYTEMEARNICKSILMAIEHCHSRNLVHRDLKPENLLMQEMDNEDNVKLVDFGYAAEANDCSLTGFMGTPIYMAPEIWNDLPYGKPVDLWAFGVISHLLLVGAPPFMESTRDELKKKIVKGHACFDDKIWDSVSSEAKNFISHLLVVAEADRLTVQQAIHHPWITCANQRLRGNNLTASLNQLKQFNARRKLKSVFKTVLQLTRWRKLFGSQSPHQSFDSPLSSSSSPSSSTNFDIDSPKGFLIETADKGEASKISPPDSPLAGPPPSRGVSMLRQMSVNFDCPQPVKKSAPSKAPPLKAAPALSSCKNELGIDLLPLSLLVSECSQVFQRQQSIIEPSSEAGLSPAVSTEITSSLQTHLPFDAAGLKSSIKDLQVVLADAISSIHERNLNNRKELKSMKTLQIEPSIAIAALEDENSDSDQESSVLVEGSQRRSSMSSLSLKRERLESLIRQLNLTRNSLRESLEESKKLLNSL